MHLPRASSPATKTTPQTKPTTTMRATSSLAMTLLLRHRGRRSSPCVASSALPSSGGPGLTGGPALGNRKASPAPLAAAASAPVPRQQQQQQQQSQPRVPPQTPHPVSSWQQWQQQQQPARQASPLPQMPPPPPSFAPAPPPQQQQQQQQGAWSPSMAAAQQQQQQQQYLQEQQYRQQQQQQQTFRRPLPPRPPSLVLPRTAVAVAAPAPFAPPRIPSQQQQQFAPPPPPLPQQQRGPPSRSPSAPPPPPPRPLASAPSPALSPSASPRPSSAPAPIVPRAGLMTVEERHAAFARAALRADASARARERLLVAGGMAEGEQRTKEWHALRDARLTASAFGNALGFWPGGRAQLWEEKVGLGKAFAGNAATDWGTRAEPRALEAFVAVARLEDDSGSTRRRVSECRFEVLCEDDAHDWLGASPDGLIELEGGGSSGSGSRGSGGGGERPPSLASLASLPTGGGGENAEPRDLDGGGVLEIKCPFNRGRPLDAEPWPSPPHYYVPQVQGLMAITGREWCDLWCWTPGRGAASFRFERDRGYWAQAFEVLADFWWAHVVPGNQAVAEAARGAESSGGAGGEGGGAGGGRQQQQQQPLGSGGGDEALLLLQRFRPADKHPLTRSIVQRSKEMAERAAREGARRFSAAELDEAIRRTK